MEGVKIEIFIRSLRGFNLENIHAQASSLTVQSEGGKRSFKVEVAPPSGMSYARDIAEKYGVTYEMLTDGI